MLYKYLKASIALEYHFDVNWYMSLVAKKIKGSEYRDGDTYTIGTEEFELGTVKITDKLSLKKGDLDCVHKDIDTTFGRFILNIFLIEVPFKGNIEFINEDIEVSDIFSKYIVPASRTMIESEWTTAVQTYSKATKVLSLLIPFIVRTQSLKLMDGPPDMDEFIAKTREKLIKKYGEDAFQSLSVISEYEAILRKHDEEYLKEDIENNVLLTKGGKATLSRKSNYASYGTAMTMTPKPGATYISENLSDGLPLDPENFVKYVNDIRKGSSDRGKDTQIGGVIAAILTRALHQFVISEEDCKTDDGLHMLVNDFNKSLLLNSYINYKGDTIHMSSEEIVEKYVGKEVTYRTFLRCKADSKNFKYCKVCAGTNAGLLEDGIALMGASMGGTYLNILMKSTHDSTIYTTEFEVDDLFT